MSRIDDDRSADLAAQRIQQQRRLEEQRKQERASGDSAFSQLIQKGNTERAQTSERKSAVQAMLEEAGALAEETEVKDSATARGADAKGRTQRATGTFQEKVKEGGIEKGERGVEDRHADDASAGMTAQGRSGDAQVGEARAQGRQGDHQTTQEGLDERGKAMSQQGGLAKGRGKEGGLKTDNDTGKGGQKGSQDQKGSSSAPAGFRFNPALMAPVPVAKAKDAAGSARLRSAANELAQKIVEKVRVGENAAGQAEFQIDLRGNVLQGLSIKVSSGRGGKIKAVFSGNDRDVLKLLEEHKDELKQALASRGLSLDDLRIEDKA